ncbi:MAG: beta-galactosidase [Clostridia bacterium]|nr:beta-galactosidase [Clostridia bacterium]
MEKNLRLEYPRPQKVRGDYIMLNGEWDFTIDNDAVGIDRGYATAEHFDMKITVPYCPESKLSGLEIKDFMYGVWYTRTVTLPESWTEGERRTFINIGACDYITRVFVNGVEVGMHRGGYVSFSFEITKALKAGENRITVYVTDDTKSDAVPSGKQSDREGSYGCFYTRTTGIWQSVWLENTPYSYIKSFKMTPSVADTSVHIDLRTAAAEGKTLITTVYYDGEMVGNDEREVKWDNLSYTVALSEEYLWDTDSPCLYDITFELGEDRVDSYFGLRDIALRDGVTYLNGRPVFQRLILDQGFYPDGIYTAPSDEELINDITRTMDMGFNGARLHEKVFEERFLYHADRLGYLVWGEYPNWGLNVAKESAYKNMLPEWLEELCRDYNHPSIIGWCPLNETQRDIDPEFVRYLYNMTKAYDPTRLFIDNSGWFHIDGTYDMYDVHDYLGEPDKFREKYWVLTRGEAAECMLDNDEGSRKTGKSDEICFVSEFGGARFILDGDNGGDNWGYGKQVKDIEDFIARYKGLVDALLDNPKISAFCYTQLTDVEQEMNGLYTYDRRAKFPPERMAEITSRPAAIEK